MLSSLSEEVLPLTLSEELSLSDEELPEKEPSLPSATALAFALAAAFPEPVPRAAPRAPRPRAENIIRTHQNPMKMQGPFRENVYLLNPIFLKNDTFRKSLRSSHTIRIKTELGFSKRNF